MRIAAHDDHPWYSPDLIGRCQIKLNGIDVSGLCFAADDERGIAYCYATDTAGEKFFDPGTKAFATSAICGKVEIIVLPGKTIH